MKAKRKDHFETNNSGRHSIIVNKFEPDRNKTWSDLRIDFAKKYGVMNLWKWWRTDNGKYTR